MVVDIPNVVNSTNFGDHRLSAFWVAGVKFSPLPFTFIVALTTISHYTVRVCDKSAIYVVVRLAITIVII